MTISRRKPLGLSAGAGFIAATGTTKPQHAKENMGSAVGRLPDAGLRREIEKFISPLL